MENIFLRAASSTNKLFKTGLNAISDIAFLLSFLVGRNNSLLSNQMKL